MRRLQTLCRRPLCIADMYPTLSPQLTSYYRLHSQIPESHCLHWWPHSVRRAGHSAASPYQLFADLSVCLLLLKSLQPDLCVVLCDPWWIVSNFGGYQNTADSEQKPWPIEKTMLFVFDSVAGVLQWSVLNWSSSECLNFRLSWRECSVYVDMLF